ncbi:hypothetical protein F511_34224 [Dorcoceras hygrometricum]|uniref:Uncharacterized protein n=1 Tax=Dorcoceras hygrometricum TaxID=472368 RepID=A0A2Z7AUB5_9LAMI|nr:hypothetical protein F511_34224 [Dorcoceras hygrometricum]
MKDLSKRSPTLPQAKETTVGSDGKLPEKLTVNSSRGNRSHQRRSLALNNAQTPKRRRSRHVSKYGRSNTLQRIPRYVIKSGHSNAKLAIQISPSSVHQNDAVATYPNDIASPSSQELASRSHNQILALNASPDLS